MTLIPQPFESAVTRPPTAGRPSTRVRVELTHNPIELEPLRQLLVDPDTGAHAWFEGVTRRMTENRQTTDLTYEAFEPMATAKLEELAQQAAASFELSAIVIVHRLGQVGIGEMSIVIGCCSPHRRGVLAALPWVMDRIKLDVPIWKRELFADGESQWIHPH